MTYFSSLFVCETQLYTIVTSDKDTRNASGGSKISVMEIYYSE